MHSKPCVKYYNTFAGKRKKKFSLSFLSIGLLYLVESFQRRRSDKRSVRRLRIGGNGVDEDFLLVLGIRNGREDAAESFVRKYYSEILNYCFAKTGDFMQAEDMTQQTFLNFFKNIGGYEHRGKAKNFLYVTAGNLCKNFYVKKERSKEMPLREEEKNVPADGRIGDFAKETADAVSIREALMKLPAEWREAVILYYFQELKIKEIAAILGQTQSNIKYRLKAAKEKLKEILGKEDFT